MSESKHHYQDNKDKKRDKSEEYKQAAMDNLVGWQKALADYQNLQKDTDKRLASLSDFTTSTCIFELLPIFDNYKVALNHIPEDQKQSSWAVGLEHILKLWETFLSDHSVTKIKTIGEPFDPYIHESVGQVSDEAQADQVIVEEKLAGYQMKEAVIRPAMVIINNK